MKKLIPRISCILIFLVFIIMISGCNKKNEGLTYRYLSAKESADVLGNLDYFYDGMSQKFLDFACQKKDASVDEYKEYSMNQTLDFTDEEKRIIDDSIARILRTFETQGYKFPENTDISFAKTTMNEAFGSAGYTHESTVFLGKEFIDYCSKYVKDYDIAAKYCDEVISHEIFHCLTRNNPDFRNKMYNIIGFSIADGDYEIPEDVKAELISNPDVIHHDSYASFTINGEKKDCYLVFLTDDVFEKEGDTFYENMYTGLVDINTGKLYRYSDATDFYDVLGYNTTYCLDPEECMAENFSYTIVYGLDGLQGDGYKTPSIIENIINCLRGEVIK